MPLELRPITSPEDFPALADLLFNSFLRIPLSAACYPKGPTPALIAPGETSARNLFDNDPSVRFLKVVDTDLADEIIAIAEWHIFETPETEAKRFDIGRGERKFQNTEEMRGDVFTNFWKGIIAGRMQTRGKAHVFLSKLATAAPHVRRGAGEMLMKWGTERADKLRLPCFLESSPDGLRLYKKCGFERVGAFMTDISLAQDGSDMYEHVVMIRPAKIEQR